MNRRRKNLPQLLQELPNEECRRAAQLLYSWAESASPNVAVEWPPTGQDGGFSAHVVSAAGVHGAPTLFQVVAAHRRNKSLGWLLIHWKENDWVRKLGEPMTRNILRRIERSRVGFEELAKGWRVPLERLAISTVFAGFTDALEDALVLLGIQGAHQSAVQTPAKESEKGNEQEPENEEEGINWRQQFVNARLGQGRFRRQVLKAYEGRCAISGCTVESALAAAHILPCVANGSTHHVSNGLLLRADLHLLFDQNLIGIDPDGPKVVPSRALLATEYGNLHDKPAFLPQDGNEPARSVFLEDHLRGIGS